MFSFASNLLSREGFRMKLLPLKGSWKQKLKEGKANVY